MSSRNCLAWTLLLAAGCGSTTLDGDIGLSEPAGVAVFTGITSKNPDLHPYVAVANGGRNDLTLIDALDDQPVLSPVIVRALAVPLDARPGFVVAGSLRDGKADLLAVVAAGSTLVQGINTWTAANQVEDALSVDLASVAPDASVLAVVAAAVPAAGTGNAEPGRVRLVFALTGGRLAVQEYERDPTGDGNGIRKVGAGPALQELGFEPVALAVAPGDDDFPAYGTPLGKRLLYAATPDDLPAGSGVHGVVEIDMTAAPGAWTTAMLPTVAPTRLVAAVKVAERNFQGGAEIPFASPYVLRVVAALDPVGCGRGEAIECGLVTVDPSPGVRGIVPDPFEELPYHPPTQLQAYPVAMLAAIPPVVPSKDDYQPGRMNLRPAGGDREVGGLVAVAASDGRVYPFDVSRRTILNDRTILRYLENSLTQSRAQGVPSFFVPTDPKPTVDQVYPILSCEADADNEGELTCSQVWEDPSAATSAVVVTPGYTRSDSVEIGWQGELPSLVERGAEVGDEGGGLFVALQDRTPEGVDQAARLWDPALGVHLGDTVVLSVNELDPTDDADPCDVADLEATKFTDESETDPHEYTITALVPPDPARVPGGAVLVADDGGACWDALRAGRTAATASIRAAGWVMVSDSDGYLGRPVTRSPAGQRDLRVRAELVHEDEAQLVCPLSPWPADPGAVVCGEGCRETCERLSLARKARRWYTVGDECKGTDAPCVADWSKFIDPDADGDPLTQDPLELERDLPPNTRGPVFRVDFTVRNVDDAGELIEDEMPAFIVRDAGVLLSLQGGHSPTNRFPLSGAIVMPTGIAAYDRSEHSKDESYRFYVSYIGDLVLDFSPGQISNTPVTIR